MIAGRVVGATVGTIAGAVGAAAGGASRIIVDMLVGPSLEESPAVLELTLTDIQQSVARAKDRL